MVTKEGSTGTFTIQMRTQPTADVSMTMMSLDPTEGKLSPTKLSFTPATWNMPQTVTVTGVDDKKKDGDKRHKILLVSVISKDPSYLAIPLTYMEAYNMDND